MEFTFTEEQLELRRSARRFLESNSTPAQVDAVMQSELGYEPELWARMCEELGWSALIIPEAYEGLGMSYLDLYPLVEEMGRSLLCSPFFATLCLGANAIIVAGNEAQKKEYLPQIAAGKLRATLAHTEKNGRPNANGVETSAERDGSDYVLNGSKRYVIDGQSAELLIVTARSEGSEDIRLFALPAETPGITRSWLPTMDQTRKQAEIVFDQVRIPADALMDGTDDATVALAKILALATAALTAEQVGGAEACLEMSVEYAKVRKQFGRAIGSFQAIKHKCADMLLKVESARSAAFYANALAAQNSPELGEAAACAKAYCSDAYFHCASENIQIHGGIGFTWEHPAHLYFKRAKSSETLLGDAAHQRERIAEIMEL